MSLYSLKMRASLNNEHISGAEKLVKDQSIIQYADTLIDRGLNHSKGKADFINLKIEEIDKDSILYLNALPVKTVKVDNYIEGRSEILKFLKELGTDKITEIMELFKETYSMRGAMLLDINTLERLEPDKNRGIRATYMDMDRTSKSHISNTKNHYMEAIVLATKVANAPGIAGEICISDDPDYVTGYVSSKEKGYIRISNMKEMGSPCGGRIFLYNGSKEDVNKTIDFLEKQLVIVKNIKELKNTALSAPNSETDTIKTSEDKLSFIDKELERLKENNLYRTMKTIDSMQSSHVIQNGLNKLMLASNSYLDMISNKEVKAYASEVLNKFGAGSGGSRLTTGSTVIHRQLEEKIAEFKKTESAIVFNSGYVANLTVISSFAGSNDVIFSDELNHASIIDGCRLSRAKIVVYAHNDMNDLEDKIKCNMPCRGMIISDAVFSMDGDILNLPQFAALGNKYNLITMIDEAHSTGVIGRTGRGILEHFDYSCDSPDIIMGTLSKAIGSEGGFVCGRKNIIQYLINKARAYIFSTSLSPVTMAASYKAFQVIEENPQLICNLHDNVKYFCSALRSHGIDVHSETPIVPIIIGDEKDALKVQEKLLSRGYYISAI
ncbi:MAG: 6-carboxyhexanoate--CoA ligase, partial [Clostridium sp.]